MSQPIETAPKDGKIVILEDDKSGTYDVAHSRKTYQWVGENGEPSKITPTHWYPKPRDKYLLQEDDRSPRRFAAWSIISTLTAVALIGVYFHAEVAGYVTRYAGLQDIFGQVVEQEAQLPSRDWRKFALLALQQQAEADQGRAQAGVQVKQAGEAAAPEAQQSPKEEGAEALLRELTEARPAIEWLNVQLRAETATRARSLEQEREKTTAAQEAAAARLGLTASTGQHRQALDEERARSGALATAQREIETQAALLRKARDDAAQFKQTAERTTAELQQERDRVEAGAAKSAQLLGEERQDATAATASMVQHRQTLDEERARSAALASELATAQREIETQAAQLRKASDETGQLKQAEAAQNAQSLEREREKTTVLAQEAAAARLELTASTAQHRQALEEGRARRAALWSELAVAQREIETQAAQLRKASDETKQLKQATESAMVELRQSLQQERARTEAMARDIESAHTVGVRVTPEPAASSPTSKAVPAVEVVAMAQPAAAEAQSSPEATRLIARASALLGQGDIGAARTVLERAAETGSAQASFMLAETYDPGILSTWGTYGTRGEVTKARELYAKAHAGGIQEAKDRFDALRR